MPAPNVARIRLQVGGAIGGSSWTCGFWLRVPTGVPLEANLTTFAEAALTKFGDDVWDLLDPINNPTTSLNRTRADYYAPSSNASSANAEATQADDFGSSSGACPASQAMCASLYSDTATRSGRGRVYLPATGGLVGGSQPYGFGAVVTSNVAAGVANFLDDLVTIGETDFGAPVIPVVQSLTVGVTYPITRVLCDTRPDRQEHREKPLAFSRFASPVGA